MVTLGPHRLEWRGCRMSEELTSASRFCLKQGGKAFHAGMRLGLKVSVSAAGLEIRTGRSSSASISTLKYRLRPANGCRCAVKSLLNNPAWDLECRLLP